MALRLNMILCDTGLNLADVRLLRHKDKRAIKGRTPYELWRDNRQQFDLYQSIQSVENRQKLAARYWVSFVVTPADETMFVGLFHVGHRRPLEKDTPKPHMDGVDKAGSVDAYDLTLETSLSDLIGRLMIDWGLAGRAWIQRADRQDKNVMELRTEFKEPEFPGFLNFLEPLSRLGSLPRSWITALRSTKGVYLLTCPMTKEQYVGSATGENGFWMTPIAVGAGSPIWPGFAVT